MGLFTRKWIVEFEASTCFLSSDKKQTMVVEASNEYEAKRVAKATLEPNYKFVKILSARVDDGKSDKKNSTYKPPIGPNNTYERNVEDRERSKEVSRVIREADKLLNKQSQIEAKQKEIEKIRKSPIKTIIIGGIITAASFLLAWIPYWCFKAIEAWERGMLNDWIEMGHSESDETGQEIVANIEKFSSLAKATIWIPIAVLLIAIGITILLFAHTKKKVPSKVEAIEKEIEALKQQ